MRGFAETTTSPVAAIEAQVPRVLEEFGLSDHVWRPLSHGENLTIRVFAPNQTDEPRFVLRVHSPDRSDQARVMTEVTWLRALHGDGFPVPEPRVTTTGGSTVPILVAAAGKSEARLATVLSWVPGRAEENLRSTNMLEMLGEFMARLHVQSCELSLGPNCRPNRWDSEGLFGPASPMSSGWRLLDRPRRELFETIVGHFRDITLSLGSSPDAFGLIHADLHFGNVIFHGAKLQAIDFDDCGMGYWLYDLAVTLETLAERPDVSWLRRALLNGYRRVRHWGHRS